ncbi:MAG: putative AlkP superfamily pyrophosphatase or phosphodiesterase [Marivirga sp.]|jgi:predicted AlkP superfamily pyrophosphatase or phosphodiesterase
MKFYSLVVLFIFLFSCQPKEERIASKKPLLVVGIVIDQMRPDYLSRYASRFGEGGFNRLLMEGYYNKNTHYNYVPTYTGPGHASIYTGTTPAIHGIIANDWYDKALERTVYCAEDTTVRSIGTTSDNGGMSPHRMLSTTITDELRLASNFKSKVIGLSIKDRGSILPAGHTPTAAYWFDDESGHFITSSYYTEALPQWVNEFNGRGLIEEYSDSVWNLSLKHDDYGASTRDSMSYERRLDKSRAATFPYDMKVLRSQNDNFQFIKKTPFGNSLLTEMAMTTINEEQLGQNEHTDFLALSYSSSDYVGHDAGPRSIEVEDMYIKLDLEIERFLKFLDQSVGKDNYLIFVTADHAAAEVPQYLIEHNIPAGYYARKAPSRVVDSVLDRQYGGGDWVSYFYNEQLSLNHDLIAEKGLNLKEVIDFCIPHLLKIEGAAEVYSALDMRKYDYPSGMKMRLQNGYNFKRSGDLLMVFEPAWFKETSEAAKHGSGYKYDTHVPLIWFGKNISTGESYRPQSITDIAPTLSFILDTQLPNGATGEPIEAVLENYMN